MIYTSILVALIILQILDGVSTYLVIKSGGVELNGIVKKFLDKLGLVNGLIVAKTLGSAFAVALYFGFPDVWCVTAAIVLVVVYTGVVINNFVVYKRIKA